MNKVIILSATGGADLVTEIRNKLTNEDIEIAENPGEMPNPWDPVVILFSVTEGSFQNPNLLAYLEEASKLDLPIVPVVEDLATSNFDDVPNSFTMIRERNAVGIQSKEGTALVETVQGYLGFSAFARHKKVFISYRRSDAKEIADKIYDYLWINRFQAFQDTFQIEGGAVVQDEIVRELEDKDFVLLLDSPDVASSKWVEEEILQTFIKRIPVCVVSIGAGSGLEIIKDKKRIPWSPLDSDNLEKIRLMISRAIASRESLNSRIERTIQQAVKLRRVAIQQLGNRQFLLRCNKKHVLLEFEDAAISLERLHRLHIGYKKQGKCNMAIFVCGDYPIHDITHEAVKWARGRCKLEVLPLVDLYKMLNQIFP